MTDTRSFASRAPVRVDCAGGGSDAPPFCLEHGGAVVNFGITRFVHVRLDALDGTRRVEIVSDDFAERIEFPSAEVIPVDGDLKLVKAVARAMNPPFGFRLRIRSDIPPGSGLGSSGALGVALVAAFHAAMETERSQAETAAVANRIERVDAGYAGGSQDSFGAALGGVNFLDHRTDGTVAPRRLKLADDTLFELERRAVIVFTGGVHLSGSIHADIKRSYALPDSPTVDAMKRLAALARRTAGALEGGDLVEFGRCLDENWVQHRRLHESCTNKLLESYYATARPHILGGKTCGAGGGGCILFLARDGSRAELEEACRALGGMLIPFTVDHHGVRAWKAQPDNTV